MNKFISGLHSTESTVFLKNALLFYTFYYSYYQYAGQPWLQYACKNLISHYNLFKAGDDCRKITLGVYGQTIESASPFLDPLSLDPIIVSLINFNNMAVLRMLFEVGAVQPADCLKYVNESKNPRAKANFVRLVRDMGLANLDDNGIYGGLIKILQSSAENSIELPLLAQLYPQILNWRFDDKGNRVSSGQTGHHLLMYAILRHSWDCAYALADNGILPNWWSITDNNSQSPFAYVNFLLSRDSHKSDEGDMKQFYCDLWDKAVVQGAGAQLDQDLSPEKLNYR